LITRKKKKASNSRCVFLLGSSSPFSLLQTLSFRPALQSSFSCLWFVVVILVLIHDCDVCSFFALFIFPLSSSTSLHYCVHFSLLARFSVIRSSLLVFLFPSTSLLFCFVP
jgi:hypothetical protein